MADGVAILSFVQAKFAHSQKAEESLKIKRIEESRRIIRINHKKVAQGEVRKRKGQRGTKRGQETKRRKIRRINAEGVR